MRRWDALCDWLHRRSREVSAAGVAALCVMSAAVVVVALMMQDGEDGGIAPTPRATENGDENAIKHGHGASEGYRHNVGVLADERRNREELDQPRVTTAAAVVSRARGAQSGPTPRAPCPGERRALRAFVAMTVGHRPCRRRRRRLLPPPLAAATPAPDDVAASSTAHDLAATSAAHALAVPPQPRHRPRP